MTKKTPIKRVQKASIVAALSLRKPSQYREQPAGKKIQNTLRNCEFRCVSDVGKGWLTGQPVVPIVPQRSKLGNGCSIEIRVFLAEEEVPRRDKVLNALWGDDRR